MSEIEDLKARISELEKKLDSTEFWGKWVFPHGANPEDIKNELHDFRTVMNEVVKVYCHITDGGISKITTKAEYVISECDDKFNRALENEIEDKVLRNGLDNKWRIWSIEHSSWWAPDQNGYTENINHAGVYDYFEACEIVRNANMSPDFPNKPMEAMIAVVEQEDGK